MSTTPIAGGKDAPALSSEKPQTNKIFVSAGKEGQQQFVNKMQWINIGFSIRNVYVYLYNVVYFHKLQIVYAFFKEHINYKW